MAGEEAPRGHWGADKENNSLFAAVIVRLAAVLGPGYLKQFSVWQTAASLPRTHSGHWQRH